MSGEAWTPSDIPERWRRKSRIGADGVLELHFANPEWTPLREAVELMSAAFSVTPEVARQTIAGRLASGVIIAGAGVISGHIGNPCERIRSTDGRDLMLPPLWDYAKLDDAFWLVGDLGVRILPKAHHLPVSRLYADVRVLRRNLIGGQVSPAPAQPLVPLALPAEQSARQIGRPRGSQYAKADAPLLDEMQDLMDRSIAFSTAGAAAMVAPRAVGGGGDDSKARRLAKAFQAREKNGA
jgi:hypothetical protein